MKPKTLELLACPECRGDLRLHGDGRPVVENLVCSSSCTSLHVAKGVPILLPHGDSDDRWRAWEQKQELGLEEYEQSAELDSDLFDDVAAEFGAFAQLHGTVLDIGCGIGGPPPYARGAVDTAKYIGIDPLNGEASMDSSSSRESGSGCRFATRSATTS